MKFLFLAILALATQAQAAGLTLAERSADFTQLKAIIATQYGPFDYKHATGVIDFDKLNAEFDAKIAATRSNQEFYSVIAEYIARFRDGHFTVTNPNVRTARVPLNLDLIDGRVLISHIDRDKLPEDKFEFAVGDEVLALDGRPVFNVMAELAKYVPSGNPATVKRKSAWALLQRSSGLFAIPAAENVTITVRHASNGVTKDATLAWTKTGSVLDEDDRSENRFLFASAPVGGLQNALL
jgi:PDZ domain